ncbi:MAG: orotidine-5'-phosphate decarboxylase [Elusimicrobiota bacterium]
MNKYDSNKIILALDVPAADAVKIIDKTKDAIAVYKLGHPLFTEAGPQIVDLLQKHSKKFFLDFKYHDIPNTVALAITAITKKYKPEMVTLHASGGKKMMAAAVDAVNKFDPSDRPKLLGVTVLTSMSPSDFAAVGVTKSVGQAVHDLAVSAADCGLAGIVCSGEEVKSVRQSVPKEFLIVVPGVRLDTNKKTDDQSRVVTPWSAWDDGADYVVIGRPIYEAADPEKVIQSMTFVV